MVAGAGLPAASESRMRYALVVVRVVVVVVIVVWGLAEMWCVITCQMWGVLLQKPR